MKDTIQKMVAHHLQILARPVGPLCLSSLSPSKEKKFDIILLPASMAFSKNVRKSVVDASSADDYVSPITHTTALQTALDRLQPQPTKEGKLHTTISLDFLANRKATVKDSFVSKYLEINNESSPTKTFFINFSPVMRNLRNEVLLTHHVSSFSPSYLEVMPVKWNKGSSFSQKHLKIRMSKLQP